MRLPRIKLQNQETIYHCMSRVVGGQFLLGPDEKRFFYNLFWSLADFCEMTVLSHTLMDNHYHHIVRAPAKVQLTDEQLLEKCRRYYGENKIQYRELKQAIERAKSQKSNNLRRLRDKYMRMIGDISVFQGQLKQRFSVWYNLQNNRKGTLWSERFKSVLVEDSLRARLSVAAYIDLNAVRAGIVDDPADYAFSGFAEASKGNQRALNAIGQIMGMDDPQQAFEQYSRELIYRDPPETDSNHAPLSQQALQELLDSGGEVSPAQIMRVRVRYFTDGVVLGSSKFVDAVFLLNKRLFGKRRYSGARTMKGCDWGNLHVIRELRAKIFG